MEKQEFYYGQKFYGIYPPSAARWADNNNADIILIETEINGSYEKYYEIVEKPEPTEPTHEEIRERRALAYRQDVDPITSHISRLRDMDMTPEIVAEIEALLLERDGIVEAIKEKYPYPEEESK